MFYEQFLSLCNENGLSPAAAAREIGLSNATTTHWAHGTEPTATTIRKVADFFGVDTDYFESEQSDSGASSGAAKNGNIVRIRELADQKGISISFISQSIGKSVGYLANISSRNVDVPTKYLPQIAKILGTSPAYLQGKTDDSKIDIPEVSSEADYGTFQFNRFYDLCKKYGMKQTHLYRMVGMPEKAGSNLRRTKNVKPEILEVWAKELHTTAAYLNGETDDPAEAAAPAEQPEKEKSPAAESRRVTDDDIKFALFGGGAVTDAQFEEVKSFARFVKERDANGQTK